MYENGPQVELDKELGKVSKRSGSVSVVEGAEGKRGCTALILHLTLHCMLEGKRNSVIHCRSFSRSCRACFAPLLVNATLQQPGMPHGILGIHVSSLLHDTCNLSEAGLQSSSACLPRLQKLKAYFERGDWKKQTNTVCVCVHTHTYMFVHCQLAGALRNWRAELERQVDVLGKINEYERFTDDRWLVSYSEGVTEEEENQL